MIIQHQQKIILCHMRNELNVAQSTKTLVFNQQVADAPYASAEPNSRSRIHGEGSVSCLIYPKFTYSNNIVSAMPVGGAFLWAQAER